MLAKKLLLCSALLGLAAIPNDANAGRRDESAYCSKYSDGSGTCSGSFAGFRNHSDPGAYIMFSRPSNSNRWFFAQFGSHSIACVPNASVTAVWPDAMTAGGYFWIDWDKYGNCTAMSHFAGSLYRNY
jgi:hypothetical protein